MTREFHSQRRIWLVLFLLCVTVSVQFSALAAQTTSHQPAGHCCLLCHVGPLPFLQSSLSSALAPVFQTVWLASPAHLDLLLDTLLVPGCSRAPPAV